MPLGLRKAFNFYCCRYAYLAQVLEVGLRKAFNFYCCRFVNVNMLIVPGLRKAFNFYCCRFRCAFRTAQGFEKGF